MTFRQISNVLHHCFPTVEQSWAVMGMSGTGEAIVERRRSPRRRVLKRGKALLHDHNTLLDCTIRDQSGGGARLIMDHAITLPKVFQLMNVTDGETREVRLVWRHGGQVGVEYLSPALKADKTGA